jgi:MATE family multidrug resistance protein
VANSIDIRAEIGDMARLAAPIVLAELGWMTMGIVDTMFVGRVSAEAIGAVSLGTVLFYGVSITASGLLLGLDTLVARSFGAGDPKDCRHSLIASLWLAVILMPLVMAIVFGIIWFLPSVGIEPGVLEATRPYLRTLTWSTPALILYFGLRRYLQATDAVRPVMITLLTANLVNVAGNWLLVFGNLGAPKLGAEGAAWATFASRLYMAGALGIVIARRDPEFFGDSWKADWRRVWELLKLGLPAAGQIALEVGVFGLVTVLVSKMSVAGLAGHQIALATVSTTFMLPLGISSAAAVRVGHALGRGDRHGAATSGWTALALGAAAMGTCALILLAAPQWVARLFTPEAEIVAAGAVLLRIAAFFQLFDGLQVVATGALRGAGDTHTAMLCHLTGYWIVGLPLGIVLGFSKGLGAAGLWIGLSAGLILIGIVLTLFWRRRARNLMSLGKPGKSAMLQ